MSSKVPRKGAFSRAAAVATNERSFVSFPNRLELSYVHAFEPCRRNTQEPHKKLYLLGILGINGKAPRISFGIPKNPQEALFFWGYWAFERRGRDRLASASEDLSRLLRPLRPLTPLGPSYVQNSYHHGLWGSITPPQAPKGPKELRGYTANDTFPRLPNSLASSDVSSFPAVQRFNRSMTRSLHVAFSLAPTMRT